MNRELSAAESDSQPRARRVPGSVLRLARREAGRTWPSYLSAGLGNFLFGLLALSALRLGMLPDEAEGVSLATDFLLLAGVANLSANWTSMNYVHLRRDDPFSAHLSFLRALPISPAEIVAGRVAVMLASTFFMSGVFFLPFYLLSGGLRQEVGPGQYLCFAAVWTGYALLCAGLILYLELGVSGQPAFRAFMGWTALLVGALVFCYWVLDVRLAAGSLALAGSYGALPGLILLAAGGAALLLLARATERRVRRRSL